MKYLEELSDGSHEFLVEIIELFKKQVIEYIAVLEKSLQDDDIESVKRTIHKSKSAIGVVGIQTLFSMLEQFDKRRISIDDKDILIEFSKQFRDITYLAIEELDTVLYKHQ